MWQGGDMWRREAMEGEEICPRVAEEGEDIRKAPRRAVASAERRRLDGPAQRLSQPSLIITLSPYHLPTFPLLLPVVRLPRLNGVSSHRCAWALWGVRARPQANTLRLRPTAL